MDEFDFGFEPAELQTSAITINFGPTCRITNLWVSDGGSAYSAELQFTTGAIVMGDETTDEYLPGTILLGARTDPDEPWIVSRNSSATVNAGENRVDTTYDFPLLPDFDVKGAWYENPDLPGVINWDITIKNRSRKSVEIGELGFPMALLNTLDGFPLNDDGMNSLLTERMVLQTHIGGAGSYLAARRVCGDAPGLLVFPGKDSPWEFTHSAPLSLRVSPGWPGVPIVYVHSRATIDREDWGDWLYGHSSIVLEPKEEKTYQICFAPVQGRHGFELALALNEYKVPAFRLTQGAVVPVNTNTYVEVCGTRPTSISSDAEDADVESESDEHGGIFALSKRSPGEARISVEDMEGRESWAHFLFTPPISDLIQARASYICAHQVGTEGQYQHGILPGDNSLNAPVEQPFDQPWGIASSLADATFLAEKNIIFLDPEQVQVLDQYVESFLLKYFHKPGQNTFSAILPSHTRSVAFDASRAQLYVYAARFYQALSRLAKHTKLTRSTEEYVALSDGLIDGMLRYADREGFFSTPLLGASTLTGHPAWKALRKDFLNQYRLPFWVGRHFSLNTLEEVAALAEESNAISAIGSVDQLLLTNKSTAPVWWSFGSEPRSSVDYESHPVLADYGPIFPSSASITTCHTLLSWLDRDYTRLDEPALRIAFGGLMAPWAMVRADGAASMGFCPDHGSSQRGLSAYSGELGWALAEYTRLATVWVLPSADRGFITFGGNVETYNRNEVPTLRITPWDGVGRKIVVRHMNIVVEVEGAKIDTLEFSADLKWLSLSLDNTNEILRRTATIKIEGMWGTEFTASEGELSSSAGTIMLKLPLEGARLREIEVTAS